MEKAQEIRFMELALREAEMAAQAGEVPVGAVVVLDGKVIARGHNRTERDGDPTAHAEMVVIRKASKKMGNWRLSAAELYVTLEPCTMCIGAAVLARIDRLIFACKDPKSGAVGSLYDISKESRLNHKIKVSQGILEEECSQVLKLFFKQLRTSARKKVP
ncbi:MAG: nucleoside deaminase [Proteobacteria bacterium]|nr:nucleoside deaminase [Pseudomonadota bacterium]